MPTRPATRIPRAARPDAQRDAQLQDAIERVWKANHGVYGARKVWHQLRRDGTVVARFMVERLMSRAELAGVARGRRVQTNCSRTGRVAAL
jgi:transposase InsO family protein